MVDSAGHLTWILIIYFGVLLILSVFGSHRSWLVWQYRRYRHNPGAPSPLPQTPPRVLVQLPIFNERYVASRLIQAVAGLDYPRECLAIQVLDDSTDDTPQLVGPLIAELRSQGVPIEHIRRGSREGYKAGALSHGLTLDSAELVAIFDADFVPSADFLQQTVGWFVDSRVGMVQTRWDHLNREYSLLTRLQSVLLDGHFVIEHTARNRSGCFFNFNGTAGIWRRTAIESAGGWHHDTLTEDLDLSYRAQALGWRFIYLPDIATPAEVPVDIESFKSQQHRWTKGAIQTARKLLPTLWRSPIPLRCKIEAGFHLLSNICFPLMVMMAALLGPVCIARTRIHIDGALWIDLPVLLMTTISMGIFYLYAQRELGRRWRDTLMELPSVLSLGIGLSLNNAWAVIEGLFQRGGEFIRTPKYRIETRRDQWKQKAYKDFRRNWLPCIESLAFLYFLWIFYYCADHRQWMALPFLGLFVWGFGYVASMSWWLRLQRSL